MNVKEELISIYKVIIVMGSSTEMSLKSQFSTILHQLHGSVILNPLSTL